MQKDFDRSITSPPTDQAEASPCGVLQGEKFHIFKPPFLVLVNALGQWLMWQPEWLEMARDVVPKMTKWMSFFAPVLVPSSSTPAKRA